MTFVDLKQSLRRLNSQCCIMKPPPSHTSITSSLVRFFMEALVARSELSKGKNQLKKKRSAGRLSWRKTQAAKEIPGLFLRDNKNVRWICASNSTDLLYFAGSFHHSKQRSEPKSLAPRSEKGQLASQVHCRPDTLNSEAPRHSPPNCQG